MKMFVALALALVATAAAEQVSQIQQVINMISELETKVVAEGEESHKVFAEFSEWCEDQNRELGFNIKTAEGEIEQLEATIAKETANMEELETKLEELGGELALDESDLKAATEIREKEQVDFEAEEKELMETIDTIQRALAILEREVAKVGGASMLQLNGANNVVDALKAMVQASLLSSSESSKLASLLQDMQSSSEDDDQAPDGAPAAAVYEAASDGKGRKQDGGIIAVLKDLLAKAEEQLDGLRKAETESLQNYQVLAQNLKDEIRFGKKDMGEDKKALGNSQASKAEAEGDHAATSKDLNSDKETKATLHANCMEKAETFEAEQKSRGEELKAIADAKKILKETTNGASEQTYGEPSFLQLASGSSMATVRFVQSLAAKTNSTALAQLAMQMASVVRVTDDPFAKVKGLIEEMIAKLEDEAAKDAEHKAFCDKELSENEAKEADKQAEIEKLTTAIDSMSAKSAQLKEEVATLEKELAALAKSQEEMDKIRAEEKELYDKNRPELEKGLEGVRLALKVLKDYYSKADKAHVAAEGAGAGIIGLLEVVESDFSKNLAEMISTEEEAVREYDEQTKQNQVDKTNKDQDVKYKTQEANTLDKNTAEAKADRSGVQKELDAVQAVLKSLHEQCDEVATPYEELKRRREAEIAGLKQALQILEGEAVLLQKGSRSLRAVRKHVA